MQVVDIRAFSVMFAVLFIPDSWHGGANKNIFARRIFGPKMTRVG